MNTAKHLARPARGAVWQGLSSSRTYAHTPIGGSGTSSFHLSDRDHPAVLAADLLFVFFDSQHDNRAYLYRLGRIAGTD